MDSYRFLEIVQAQHEYCLNLMNFKGATEYASNDDRLKNFKEDEAQVGIDRMEALLVMLNKHSRAVQNFVKRLMEAHKERQDARRNGMMKDLKPELYDVNHPCYWQWLVNDMNLAEPIEGRVADIQNYLYLLLAIMDDRGIKLPLIMTYPEPPVRTE